MSTSKTSSLRWTPRSKRKALLSRNLLPLRRQAPKNDRGAIFSACGRSVEGAGAQMKLHVAHQVPGRLRMKVSSAKGNPELLKQIGETFSAIPGIERVLVNPATGSVVLHYDTDSHDEFRGEFDRHYQSTIAQCCSPPTPK
jgi:Heavy metal associated domain 2